jgi:hypothetical protein
MPRKTSDMMKESVKNRKTPNTNEKEVLLSSGATLLNLACSNDPAGAFLSGKYYFLVGDSRAGKTFLSMTLFAEATINKAFSNHRLIYDNVEDGMLFDIEALFNKEVAERLEHPGSARAPCSRSIEEFYFHLDDAIGTAKEDETPFVYVLDSMDGLDSDAASDKFEEHKKAHRTGKTAAGSYGDGKAKVNSQNIRRCLSGLRDTNSILLVVSQTRDNLGFGFKTKTRSGGHALQFYSTVEIWTSLVGSIKKTVKGREREIGVNVRAKIEKNRITGERNTVQLPIYSSYGIDDIGSCVDYLIEEGHWSKKKQSIMAEDFDITATREKLIQTIEKEGWVEELREIVGDVWNSIREECRLDRKSKYS